MIFKKSPDLDFLNRMAEDTMSSYLGINFTGIGEDYLEAEMPVTSKTRQPMGLLHGGANVVLAETLGSVAGNLALEDDDHYIVGLEINANHIRSVKSGKVKGIAKPVHLGRKTQIWEIKIHDETGKLTCISRITLAVLEK
ncbi:hotdog fold thioesterase [Negadavirga shengliensis]|uniref:Hotdog fold thioesterase n=1 Tax=Negadavirga shengliensis TaxID=1389218 RepID=A0ABV9T2F3_9BACT